MLIILVRYQRIVNAAGCAVIGRPAGRRGEEQKMRLFGNNAINSTYCLKYHLKPSRIQKNE